MVKNIFLAFFLAITALALTTKPVLATPAGMVNCGSPPAVNCSYTADCATGCDPGDFDCGSNCSGGGGPGPGGTSCGGGCALDFSGFGNVNNIWITDRTPTSFTVNWDYEGFGCGRYGRFVISVGTRKEYVDTNCFNGGGSYPGNVGYAGNLSNRNFTVNDIPPYPYCVAMRVVEDTNVRSLNTAAAGITINPNTTYYVKVAPHVSKCFGTGVNEECTNNFCGSPGSEPFLGQCAVSPASAQMNVNETKEFQTPVNTGLNTVTMFPWKTLWGVSTHPGEKDPNCERMCGGPPPQIVDGLYFDGLDWGTGNIKIVVDFPPRHYESIKPIQQISGHQRVYVPDYELYAAGWDLGSISCASGICRSSYTWSVSYVPSTIRPPNQYNIANVSYSESTALPSPPYISIANNAQYPNPDPTYPYKALVTATRKTYPSATSLRSTVFARNSPTDYACTGTAPITINEALPVESWWQVKDSDVQSNGNLDSAVPTSNYFGLPGAGGFPGVTAYSAGATASFGLGSVAAAPNNWLAQSSLLSPKTFNYDYFANLIPSDIQVNSINSASSLVGNSPPATPDANGYEWYKYDGADNNDQDLTLTAVDFINRKVILLINNANLNITGNIGLTNGQGFFMAIAGEKTDGSRGHIIVNKTVTSIEGLYVSDNDFKDTENGSIGTSALHVRGSVAAYGRVQMLRDLGIGNTAPADLFEYAPDQIMLLPRAFGTRKINWKEVAP